MKEVIPPIERKLLEQELTPEKLLRETNNAGNELYIIDHHDSPNTMLEIGRLREISFRAANGGTGKEVDIDAYDTKDNPYKQLLVWDPQEKEILGGYRYKLGKEIDVDEYGVHIATAKLFDFSDKFIKEYLPHTIELGRSFVQPAYQSTQRGKKSLYALDNLWDGLGAIYVDNIDDYKYFFGKVTMYTTYNPEARNLILYFLKKHFSDKEEMVKPFNPLETGMDEAKMASLLKADNFQDDLKTLSQEVRARGEVIPPLINAYINLSPTLRSFGTVLNDGFGGVEETAILLCSEDIYPAKTDRHINSYKEWLAKKK